MEVLEIHLWYSIRSSLIFIGTPKMKCVIMKISIIDNSSNVLKCLYLQLDGSRNPNTENKTQSHLKYELSASEESLNLCIVSERSPTT